MQLDSNARNLRERQADFRQPPGEFGLRSTPPNRDVRRERATPGFNSHSQPSIPASRFRASSSRNSVLQDKRRKRRDEPPRPRDVVCFHCNKSGHYATECTEKRQDREPSQRLHAVRIDDPDTKDPTREEPTDFGDDEGSSDESGNKEPL